MRNVFPYIVTFILGLLAAVLVWSIAKTPAEATTTTTTVYVPVPITNTADPFLKNGDAMAIARVLYGMKHYDLTDNAKRAVIEVIMYRRLYKMDVWKDCNGIVDICYQANQWQGSPSPTSSYTEEDYQFVVDWMANPQTALPCRCYWVTGCENQGVNVKDRWEGGSYHEWTVR